MPSVLGAGCGCAPNAAVQWPAFAALMISGLAIFALGLRRATTPPAPGTPRRSPAAALVRPAVTGVLLVTLAAVVALASLDATGSLLALAVGAVVASAGIGSSRLRLTRR